MALLCAYQMIKQKILNGIKLAIIFLLMIAISMLVIMRWKSDIIIDKVLSSVQQELVDSLHYTTADMNWFSHFPLMSVQIYDLSIGTKTSSFIQHGDVAVVIGLLPLLKNQIIINQLVLKDGAIHIHQHQGKWSYAIFKKKETPAAEEYTTQIRQLVIENTILTYADEASNQLDLMIEKGVFRGSMVGNLLESDIQLESTVRTLSFEDYTLPAPFKSTLNGNYSFHFDSGLQQFTALEVNHEAIHLMLNGSLQKDTIEVDLKWKDANPELIKVWLPENLTNKIKPYQVKGIIEGQSKIQGVFSKKNNLRIDADVSLKNGTVTFLPSKQEINGIRIDLSYNTGAYQTRGRPELNILFEKSGTFKGRVTVDNLQRPVFDIAFDGSLASSLLNIMEMPGLVFEEGALEIEALEIHKIQPSNFSLQTLFQQGIKSVDIKDLRFQYHQNTIDITNGNLQLIDQSLKVDLNKLVWNKATISHLTGNVASQNSKLDYQLSGELCEGKFTTTGVVSGMNERPAIHSTWKVSGIAIDQLLKSFSNFDQTFITYENLRGKTNLWVESVLPFDDKWNLLSKQVVLKSAIEIHEGRLSGMRAFEDFSKFVELEDLRDIRFNQIRNYMLIEKGKVFLPVMFIQSSALNLSISGEHGFNEEIIYYLKLNAGQIAGKKLKKNHKQQDFVRASKSGWINMYFALSGTTTDIKYQQYKKAVIAGFEQSSVVKDKLRDELVEKFGYEVYWMEPNEWEDIPEYQ
jgi:hypothetical protein